MRGVVVGLVWLLLSATTPADARPARSDTAVVHQRLAARLLKKGQYEAAALQLLRAYELRHDAELLFAIAEAYRSAGRVADAVESYRRYLATIRPRNAAAARRALGDLEWSLQNAPQPAPSPAPAPAPPVAEPPPVVATAPAPEEPPPPPPRPVDRGRSRRIAGLSVGAVGLALLGAGTAFAVLTRRRSDELTALSEQRLAFDPAKEAEGRTDQILGGVFLGVGAAALATGVALYVVGHVASRRPAEKAGRGARLARAGGALW